MKKKTLRLWMLIASVSLTIVSCSDKEDDPSQPDNPTALDDNDLKKFTEREVPVNRSGVDAGTVTLRYYEDMGDVAYISTADYHRLMIPGAQYSVNYKEEGLYELTSPTGKAIVDTRKETFSSTDYEAFTNMMGLIKPGMPNVSYDSSPFLTFSSVMTMPAAVPVTLDYGKYGIDLRGDGHAVYFPLATINDLYTDGENHRACFNGERIVVLADPLASGPEDFDEDYYRPLCHETRSAEMASFSYRNLCFTLDHFFGYPGRSAIEAKMKTDGLDKALSAQGEAGELVKKLLQSTNNLEYMAGMKLLGCFLFDGGHTNLDVSEFTSSYPDFEEQYDAEEEQQTELFSNYSDLIINIALEAEEGENRSNGRQQLRSNAYGEGEYYVKYGNTAVCVFDSFEYNDLNAWNQYYAGQASMPTPETCPGDPFVQFVDALQQAEADPEVENFILDITNNGGGCSDLVVTINSVMNGNSYVCSVNALTGMHSIITYEVDRNFNGKIDADDKEVKYHLNFGILQSSSSFSCGNLLPALAKDQGLPIIGEKSGGGSCCVQSMTTPEGLSYNISSHRSRLVDKNMQNIDGGITPTIPIALGDDITFETEDGDCTIPDYSNYYNLEFLNTLMNEYYR